MDVARRLKFGLAAMVALMGTAFFAAPALADTQPDPTESNVPYLAWRGEQVRLVKCAPSITGVLQRADFLLVDWSGEEHALAIPQMEGGTAGFLTATGPDHAGQGCVAATFSSQKAGLAQIKLIVSSLPGGIGNANYTPGTGAVGFLPGGNVVGLAGTPILKHDFLVGWMNLNPPVLSVGNPPGPLGDVPTTGFPTPGAEVLSDVAGTGPNNFRVDVTGNIPLRADFRELGLGDTLQLPRDWARLAVVMGTYFNPDNPAPGGQWDIHDDRSTAEQGGTNLNPPNGPPYPTGSGHGFQSVCPSLTALERSLRIDVVDNCPQLLTVIGPAGLPVPRFAGGFGEFGAFSRLWSTPTTPTIGPFDPLKPSETLLSNGILDANDAPMPAARIDFTTSGGGFFGCVGSTPVSGPGAVSVGDGNCSTVAVSASNSSGTASVPLGPALVPQQRAKDKHVIYSRNGTGAATAAAPNEHNLYAPFYGRFIPATARGRSFPCTGVGTPAGCDPRLPSNFAPQPESSGEDGPAGSVLDNTDRACAANPPVGGCPNIGTNNFNGWLVNGLYHYWDIARVLNNGAIAPSSCLLRFVTTFTPTPGATTPGTLTMTRVAVPRFLPSGPSNVVVYTDEHGEAHVNWYPGVNFSFAGIASNLNLGCELQNVSPLATPNIQAIARYPYQPVTAPPLLSNTFTKTVTSLFNKQLQCAPKGTSPNDQFSQICVISARDITGSPVPFIGEVVCFFSNAEAMQYYSTAIGTTLPASLGGGPVNGTLLTPAEVASLGKAGAAIMCQRLDINGRAAIEVFGKGPSNVIADLVDEGLIRVLPFTFASGVGATGTSEAPSAATVATAAASVSAADTKVVGANGQLIIQNTSNSKPETAVIGTTKTPPAVRYTVVKADLMTPVQGKAYLNVRVNGPQANVKIRIRLIGARSTVTIDRMVPTNKLVKVKNLKITATVRSIKVSVVS